MSLLAPRADRIQARLSRLYGGAAADTFTKISRLAERFGQLRGKPPANASLWSERDAVLITYGDQVRAENQAPLSTLTAFLAEQGLADRLSTVHLLPCFPYSSDDGFSVIDYTRIDPNLGDWEDIASLGGRVDLMFDLVLNHCSQQHKWFQRFLKGEKPYRDFFITVDPQTDLSQVTRPRSTPLLTPFETAEGTRYVWTTFSADQVDLNFANPEVLVAMLEVLLLYIQHGARIVRLDAIAYLWKQIGTNCIHLPQTHEVVKLMRDLVDAVAPGVILLTETNVPHRENVSYFGDGDEAQMVYQFPLAPLLLDAFLSEDATPLNNWLTNLEPPPPGTTYFNFTASHDGVGVRPLEGLVTGERLERLIAAIRDRGGHVSTKRNPDGSDSPYELNITYFSALGGSAIATEQHVRRFLSSQAIMLALQGMPGIYFHSLVGTPNFAEGVEETGRARTINRRKYQRSELNALLQDEQAVPRQVLDGYRHLLDVRRQQSAFHPDAPQTVLAPQHPAQIAFLRTSRDESQRLLIVANCSDKPTSFSCSAAGVNRPQQDLLDTKADLSGDTVPLPPGSVRWVSVSESVRKLGP